MVGLRSYLLAALLLIASATAVAADQRLVAPAAATSWQAQLDDADGDLKQIAAVISRAKEANLPEDEMQEVRRLAQRVLLDVRVQSDTFWLGLLFGLLFGLLLGLLFGVGRFGSAWRHFCPQAHAPTQKITDAVRDLKDVLKSATGIAEIGAAMEVSLLPHFSDISHRDLLQNWPSPFCHTRH